MKKLKKALKKTGENYICFIGDENGESKLLTNIEDDNLFADILFASLIQYCDGDLANVAPVWEKVNKVANFMFKVHDNVQNIADLLKKIDSTVEK